MYSVNKASFKTVDLMMVKLLAEVHNDKENLGALMSEFFFKLDRHTRLFRRFSDEKHKQDM